VCVCVCVCVCACMCVCVCIHEVACIRICICICICVYVNIYIYIYSCRHDKIQVHILLIVRCFISNESVNNDLADPHHSRDLRASKHCEGRSKHAHTLD